MHIFEREISGRRYRILATTVRVAGRKQPVSRQVSLGPVESDERFAPSQCDEAGFRRVGDVGALVSMAEELGVLDAFDAEAPGSGMGPSLGEVILAVALQRVCAPGAKRDLASFLDEALPRFSVSRSKAFTGQAFHRLTREVAEESYEKVQLAVAQRACKLYRLKTDVLAYDTTNFDTFIATTTESALARRGHAKSKRADLKVVGLALMTSSTHSVPLFHRTYAGNESDKTVLAQTLGALAKLQAQLGPADRTLVRDGGFAGTQLEFDLGRSGYHSVSVLALSTTVSRDALAAAVGKLEPLAGKLRDVGAWRTRVQFDDDVGTVTGNPTWPMATTAGNLLQRTRCPYFRDVASACNKRQPGSGCAAIGGYNRMHALLGTSDKCIATFPGDMPVALAALDAVVRTERPRGGGRAIPLRDFYVSYGDEPARETVLDHGELVVAVDLPADAWLARSHYLKIRDRASYEFALASAAVALDIEGGKVRQARVALGGVATKPWRSPEAEKSLTGSPAGEDTWRAAAEAALAGARPRRGNEFKVDLAKRTLARALATAAARKSA